MFAFLSISAILVLLQCSLYVNAQTADEHENCQVSTIILYIYNYEVLSLLHCLQPYFASYICTNT